MITEIDQEKIARITSEVARELKERGYGQSTGSGADAQPVRAATLAPEEVGISPGGAPTVTCNVSNRHIHLTREDFATLFGDGEEPTVRNMLMQPGQFASEQTMSLIAGRGRAIEHVRLLAPLRKFTQIEISRTDGFFLGIRPPVRASGNIEGSAAATLIGPKGTLLLRQGIIVADRHIHTPPEVAERFGLVNNQLIRVRVFHTEKPTIFENVRIRIDAAFVLEMHIDNDDANSAGIVSGDRLEMIV